MADKLFGNIRYLFPHITDAQWASSNPILKDGEIAFSIDKKMYKIGDGKSDWESLPYNDANNAKTASKLSKMITITLSGAVTGTINFDGSGSVGAYTVVNHTHPATDITTDDEHRFVTVNDITGWNSKAAGVHTHKATDITLDASHRFVTDTEKTTWNGKAAGNHTHNYIPTTASCNKNWNWVGKGGQPTWLWGGEDSTNEYLYNPANFSVNYAKSAGTANAVAWANITGKPGSFTPSNHDHSELIVRNAGLELYGGTPFIDFHFNNSTADRTARIIEWTSGTLTVHNNLIVAQKFNVGGTAITDNNITCAHFTSTGQITFKNSTGITIGLYNSEFRPPSNNDNKINLGGTDGRWKKIYCASNVIGTSDERDKNILGGFDNRHKELFMKLKPITFTWKDSDDTSIHYGLGAQTTEETALSCGISENEIAAIEHSYWDEPSKDGRTDRYGMIYEEIQMLTIPVVQDHENKINTLTKELEKANKRIEELEKLVS